MKLLSYMAFLAIGITNVSADVDCQALYTNQSALAEPVECANFIQNKVSNAPHINTVTTVNNAITDNATFYDMGFISDNFGTHPMGDLSAQTILNAGISDQYFGMDYDPTGTILYAVDFGTNNLVILNTDGTLASTVGPLTNLLAGENVSGITISSTGSCYVSGTDSIDSTLYSCDLSTGTLTVIGTQNTTPLLIDIEVSCDGTIYGHDIGTDSFYTLNPTTGAATLLGIPHGLDANFAQGMTIDHEADVLYAYIYTGGGANTYASVNIADGSINVLNVDSPTGEFTGASQTTCAAPLAPPALVPSSSMWSILSFILLIGVFATWKFRNKV